MSSVEVSRVQAPAWRASLAAHWPEYLIEASCLGIFMISACTFGVLLEHPDSPVHRAIASPDARRVLMGLAMGLTAISLIYSRPGKRSGAHMNPAVTLTFHWLDKLQSWDTVFYVAAQFLGGAMGVGVARVFMERYLAAPAVQYVATVPGAMGVAWAFAAEVVITFVLMSTVLRVSNSPGLNRYTGLCAGALVMLYISVEAPISGMSMNPARSLASALPSLNFQHLWIYFTAPPLGMLLAAELFVRQRGLAKVLCAKLHHENSERCIFRCSF